MAEEKATQAMSKLKKDRVDIDINPKRFLLEFTQGELKRLEEQPVEGLSDLDKEALEAVKKSHRANVEEYSKAQLKAIMVPLKYRDLQTVKSGIFEAIQAAKKYNWDDDVKIRAMMREEHTLTVYLSLRKKGDISKLYYDNLEDICAENDAAIDELYQTYLDNFVLTEAERKNS